MSDPRLLVASNRGPVTFVRDEEGGLTPRRGAGGLVTAMTSAVEATGGLWVASAMSEGDRARAAESLDGRLDVAVDGSKHHLHLVVADPDDYAAFYDRISNRLLWFLYHALWDLPRVPSFDAGTRRDWERYRTVNRSFAEVLAQDAGRGPADVLVQDYHLTLVPAALRRRDPQARIAYFHHVPFADPGLFVLLPEWMRRDLLEGLLGADVVGFQSKRWAGRFLACCELLDGARVRGTRVAWEGREVRVGVFPVAVDAGHLRAQSGAPEVARKREALQGAIGERRLILRVDRTELSKNVVRGIAAYGELLARHPEWRGKVVHLCLLHPSRQDLEEYRAYLEACRRAAAAVNDRFGDGSVDLRVSDDYEEVIAAFGIYDVLVVNPLYDGMNLVAKEGAVLNERDGVLILSKTAGAADTLAQHALAVDALDVTATADAMDHALRMPKDERSDRARRLRRAASGSAAAWLERQIRALRR